MLLYTKKLNWEPGVDNSPFWFNQIGSEWPIPPIPISFIGDSQPAFSTSPVVTVMFHFASRKSSSLTRHYSSMITYCVLLAQDWRSYLHSVQVYLSDNLNTINIRLIQDDKKQPLAIPRRGNWRSIFPSTCPESSHLLQMNKYWTLSTSDSDTRILSINTPAP